MASETHLPRQMLYTLQQSSQNILRSPLMSLIVVSTMLIALSTLGFLLLVMSDLNHMSDEMATQLKIVVFLDDQQDIDKIAGDIEAISGVKQPLVKVDREQALEMMTQDLPDLKEILETDNPFPASIEVAVTSIELMDDVGESIRGLVGVEDVQFNQELSYQLEKVQNSVQLVGAILAAVLILATLAIVVNTIQLAVHYRHTEIEIMRLVGAPHWFIRLPFILEGLIFGLVSSVLAAVLLLFWRVVPYAQLRQWLGFLPLSDSLMPILWISGLLLVAGLGVGSLGSLLAVRRYLRLEV
ncbi:MAG: ABC transporter permease [Candidatus Sericytochromatia bacterium]|nr:ABC transporter permease [Candidatus Sericytochromatia bacterium]